MMMTAEERQGYDIFYYASEGNQTDLERICKKQKNWLHQKDHRGRTAVMYAAMSDNLKNIQYLVRKGESLIAVDNNEATALHWATHCGSVKAISYILANSKSPDGKAPFLTADKEGVTPLHIAATKPNAKILKMFINEITPNDDAFQFAKERRDRSPLHFAASRASLDAVRTILDSTKLGLPVDQKDKFGLTPLMCAVGVVLPQAVDVCRLLAKKKTVSVSARNRDGQTALHLAVAASNKPVVELFVNELETNLEVPDNENRTALHYAAEQGNDEIVDLLLKKGAKNAKDKYGVTPAHYAAQFSVTCLDLILTAFNINEVKDDDGRTCLMWAVCAGNEEAIEYLIKKSAPERTGMDVRGFTALHLAAMLGNENICKLLFKQGWSITAPDKSHNSPLHLAAGRGHTDVVRFLVTSGANMNERDAMERTPVFWACLGGQAHTLYCMIKEMSFEWRTMGEEANPIIDALGHTPLHAAAFAGSSACINMLLNIEEEDDCLSRPLIGYTDREGKTALHEACYRGRLDCVLALLKGGAAVNTMDKNGKTAYDMALERNHHSIAIQLRSENALTSLELKNQAANVIQSWWKWKRIHDRMNNKHRVKNIIPKFEQKNKAATDAEQKHKRLK